MTSTLRIDFKDGSFMLIPRASSEDIKAAEEKYGDEIVDFTTFKEKEER